MTFSDPCIIILNVPADMAESADALDSGSSEHYAHGGSSPLIRTKTYKAELRNGFGFVFYNRITMKL